MRAAGRVGDGGVEATGIGGGSRRGRGRSEVGGEIRGRAGGGSRPDPGKSGVSRAHFLEAQPHPFIVYRISVKTPIRVQTPREGTSPLLR